MPPDTAHEVSSLNLPKNVTKLVVCCSHNWHFYLFHACFLSSNFSKAIIISRKFLTQIPSVLNSLDPDQARHFVWPDLGPNCLQQLSVKNITRLRVKGEKGAFFLNCLLFVSLLNKISNSPVAPHLMASHMGPHHFTMSLFTAFQGLKGIHYMVNYN